MNSLLISCQTLLTLQNSIWWCFSILTCFPFIFELIFSFRHFTLLDKVYNQFMCFFALLLLQTLVYTVYLILTLKHQYLLISLEMFKLKNSSADRPMIFSSSNPDLCQSQEQISSRKNLALKDSSGFLRLIDDDRKYVKNLLVLFVLLIFLGCGLLWHKSSRFYGRLIMWILGASFYYFYESGETWFGMNDANLFKKNFFNMIGTDCVKELQELTSSIRQRYTGNLQQLNSIFPDDAKNSCANINLEMCDAESDPQQSRSSINRRPPKRKSKSVERGNFSHSAFFDLLDSSRKMMPRSMTPPSVPVIYESD